MTDDRDLDADLEKRFVAGDVDALRATWDALGPLVYTYCRRTAPAELVDDVVQEVFVAAWRDRERFDPARGRLVGWFVGIAKHKVVDALRRRARAPEIAAERGDAAIGDEVEAIADRMLAAHALSCLPERTRRVIELAYLADLTHAEIADRCDIPLGTVKSDIRRGLQQIRAYLGAPDAFAV